MGTEHPLVQQVRGLLQRYGQVVEKRMFGGVAFMVNGHMCCGVTGDRLMVRVGSERYESALARPDARPMDFTGTPMTGFVYVDAPAVADEPALAAWIRDGLEFVATLPAR